MKLYHYVHCPFCIRVRMVLGLLNKPFDSIVLPYNDESTPVNLTGVKMLPIMDFGDEGHFNESLDIIAKLDSDNILQNEKLDSDQRVLVEELLSAIGSNVHSLCMPYWIWTPEFNDESRKYFQKKKEVKRGPFNQLVHKREKFLSELYQILSTLEESVEEYYMSNSLSIFDIMIASHLWGMYIYPEFQFSDKIHQYLQRVKRDCRFDYHVDFWKD
ncbi:glutaredoxin 2 [Halobacteriovorax marinus]|uniref:glutaredoxin 2 n=1 Tax=Halobacteriovorax marinus TaxID=97084 RepID=UPI003A93E06B